MKIKGIFISLFVTIILAGLFASCEETENYVPENCVVLLVTNINPLVAGDTITMEAEPGTILQDVPVITKPGKTFGGWFTSDNKITASFFDIVNTPIYLDKILYANWN